MPLAAACNNISRNSLNCLTAFFRIVSHIDRATPETAGYDLCCTSRLASKHALIAEKTEGHHAHLVNIPNGVHRRNQHLDGQSKAMSGTPNQLIQDLDAIANPRLVIAIIEHTQQRRLRISPALAGKLAPTCRKQPRFKSLAWVR